MGIIVLEDEKDCDNEDDDCSMSIASVASAVRTTRYVQPMDDWTLISLWFEEFKLVFLTVVSAWSFCLAIERAIALSK